MKKLRISYTLLSYWSKGQVDQAVSYYLKLPQEDTQAMREGREWGKKNEDEMNKNKQMIKEFLGIKLTDPKPEQKFEVNYSDHFDLVIVPDCLDGTTLYETKTGKRSSVSYLSSPQLALYYLGLKLKDYPITKIKVIRYNQHTDKTDWAMKHTGQHLYEEADNYIQSLAPEIMEYFTKINIL